MEPRQQGGIERAPVSPGEYRGLPGETLSVPDREQTKERRPDAGAAQLEASQIAMPTLPTPVIAAPQPVVQQPSDDDVPDVAGDDDLIEKEWVDKAKKILAETKDDPYRREQEINKLQIEYIRRRYGREIGNAGD